MHTLTDCCAEPFLVAYDTKMHIIPHPESGLLLPSLFSPLTNLSVLCRKAAEGVLGCGMQKTSRLDLGAGRHLTLRKKLKEEI